MTENLRSFYEKRGVDYDAFLRRLMGKESLVQKYLTLFLADSTFLELKDAVNAKNYDEVLKKAHTLKGVALNINLTVLGSLSTQIVEDLRAGNTDTTGALFAKLQTEYEQILSELEK